MMLPFYDGTSLFGEGGSPKLDLFQPWLALVAEVSTDVELRAIRDVFDAAIWEWETANHFASVLHLLQSGPAGPPFASFPPCPRPLRRLPDSGNELPTGSASMARVTKLLSMLLSLSRWPCISNACVPASSSFRC